MRRCGYQLRVFDYKSRKSEVFPITYYRVRPFKLRSSRRIKWPGKREKNSPLTGDL